MFLPFFYRFDVLKYLYNLGQFGITQESYANRKHWKIAVLRAFYVTFHIASCFFVFLIVLLRTGVVRDPLQEKNHDKTIKGACVIIWCLSITLNLFPILSAILVYFDKDMSLIPMVNCYKIVLHVGLTLPIVLTILANICLGLFMRKMKHSSENSLGKRINFAAMQKLSNGLAIWLIICNVSYIAWQHWSMDLYTRTGKLYTGVDGVLFTAIARLLLQFNSTVNPMVYATTVPGFKETIQKPFKLTPKGDHNSS